MNLKYLAQLSTIVQFYQTTSLNGLISICTLLTDLAVYYLLNTTSETDLLINNIAAIGSGLVVGATLHTQYNKPQAKEKIIFQLLRLGTVAFGGYWLSVYLIIGLVGLFDISFIQAKVISLPVFFLFHHAIIAKFTTYLAYEGRVSATYPPPAPNPPPLVPLQQALRIRRPEDHTRP